MRKSHHIVGLCIKTCSIWKLLMHTMTFTFAKRYIITLLYTVHLFITIWLIVLLSRSIMYFFLISLMNGKYLDVFGSNPSPGALVVPWPKKQSDNDSQIWYFSEDQYFICSKLNGLMLESYLGKCFISKLIT